MGLVRLPMLKMYSTWRWWLVVVLLLAALAIGWNILLPLQLYPVLVSATMLCLFGYSLAFPPTIIERLVRIREPNLPPRAVIYTRRVTQVWCGFFAVNGCIALITVLWGSAKVWTLYNGVIAYVLMGLLFAGEYGVRFYFKRQQHV